MQGFPAWFSDQQILQFERISVGISGRLYWKPRPLPFLRYFLWVGSMHDVCFSVLLSTEIISTGAQMTALKSLLDVQTDSTQSACISVKTDFLQESNMGSESASMLSGISKIQRFPTTRWTVVQRVAPEGTEESSRALEWLYQAYWTPLFSTVLRMGLKFHEAEDLTQGFLTKLILNGTWSTADPAKGTLRGYLCTGLRRFVFDEVGRRQRRPLDYRSEVPEGAFDQEMSLVFDRAWALQVFERAQRRLVIDLVRSSDYPVSKVLLQKILSGGMHPVNAEIAAAHGLTEDAVKMRSMRLRKQWQRALQEEVAKTVPSPEEIDPELRHLVRSLAQGGYRDEVT